MTDKPILFSAPMIRALIAGRKTQTRRALNLPTKTKHGPIYERKDMGGWAPTTVGGGGSFTIRNGERIPAPEQSAIWHQTCGVCMVTPFQPGDRLWVRESWRTAAVHDDQSPVGIMAACTEAGYNDPWMPVAFEADGITRDWVEDAGDTGRLRASMHMPRCCSRLTLTVTEVRVQRLRDISEADAIAEGMVRCDVEGDEAFGAWSGGVDFIHGDTARGAYRRTWEIINGEDAWAANPWVAAYTFSVRRANIDRAAP